MKKNSALIIGIIVSVAVFVGVYFLYDKLSTDYAPDNLVSQTETTDKTDNDVKDYTAPDFTVTDENGKEVKLSDFKGKPVVLNFWATWCYYCKEEMPDFNTAYKKYPEVQFLMVNATDGVSETEQKARAYIEENGFAFPVFFDKKQEAVYSYNVTGFPSTFFIDEDGNLVTYASGMLSLEMLEKGIGMITG